MRRPPPPPPPDEPSPPPLPRRPSASSPVVSPSGDAPPPLPNRNTGPLPPPLPAPRPQTNRPEEAHRPSAVPLTVEEEYLDPSQPDQEEYLMPDEEGSQEDNYEEMTRNEAPKVPLPFTPGPPPVPPVKPGKSSQAQQASKRPALPLPTRKVSPSNQAPKTGSTLLRPWNSFREMLERPKLLKEDERKRKVSSPVAPAEQKETPEPPLEPEEEDTYTAPDDLDVPLSPRQGNVDSDSGEETDEDDWGDEFADVDPAHPNDPPVKEDQDVYVEPNSDTPVKGSKPNAREPSSKLQGLMARFNAQPNDSNNNKGHKGKPLPLPPDPRPQKESAPPKPPHKPKPEMIPRAKGPQLPKKPPKPGPGQPQLPPPRPASGDDSGSAGSMSSGTSGSGGQVPPLVRKGSMVEELKAIMASGLHGLRPSALHGQGVSTPNGDVPTGDDSVYLDGESKPQLPSKHPFARYDWFHEDADRKKASERVKAVCKEGAYLVRPSSNKDEKSLQYTLVIWSGNKMANLHINQRPDKKFAIGSPKPDEMRFESVPGLIEHHRDSNITLENGGVVKLSVIVPRF